MTDRTDGIGLIQTPYRINLGTYLPWVAMACMSGVFIYISIIMLYNIVNLIGVHEIREYIGGYQILMKIAMLIMWLIILMIQVYAIIIIKLRLRKGMLVYDARINNFTFYDVFGRFISLSTDSIKKITVLRRSLRSMLWIAAIKMEDSSYLVPVGLVPNFEEVVKAIGETESFHVGEKKSIIFGRFIEILPHTAVH